MTTTHEIADDDPDYQDAPDIEDDLPPETDPAQVPPDEGDAGEAGAR